MKRVKKGNLKRRMAVMMLACMLLTMGTVNSNTDSENGILSCGEETEMETDEL